MNKRGISPIIATILLIAFAVAIGAMIMNWTAGAGEKDASCDDIPTNVLNPNSFCKLANQLVPIISKDGSVTACEDKSITIADIPNC
jgi:flagellin-like protein